MDTTQDDPDDAGHVEIPPELLELHQVIEWQRAVARAEAGHDD